LELCEGLISLGVSSYGTGDYIEKSWETKLNHVNSTTMYKMFKSNLGWKMVSSFLNWVYVKSRFCISGRYRIMEKVLQK